MSDFTEYSLGEIASVQTGPFGSQLHMADYVMDGTPIITVEHFGENRVIHKNLPLVGDADKSRLAKYTLKAGDVVFSRVGSVDRRVYITEQENGWMFSGRCLRVRCNPAIVNGKFLSYYFGQESFKEYIRMVAVGATMPSINTQILSEASISIPCLNEQENIAEILSSLDDKIDLLHRNNKTLEQLAETLFRQWFVEEADESWGDGFLYDIIDLVGGGTPKTEIEKYWNGNVGWIAGGDITENHKGVIVETVKRITTEGVENSSAKVIEKYATVISARGTVGKYCLLGSPMAFSQSNYGVRPKAHNAYFFTYLIVGYCVEELQAAAYGTVFDTITSNTFKNLRIKTPSESDIMRFDASVSPFFYKIEANTKQIQRLTILRDTLLPKLMNGSLKVK